MQAYERLVALALICANQSRNAHSKEAAAVLWKMAREYQDKAAKLDGGGLPDIGRPPARLE